MQYLTCTILLQYCCTQILGSRHQTRGYFRSSLNRMGCIIHACTMYKTLPYYLHTRREHNYFHSTINWMWHKKNMHVPWTKHYYNYYRHTRQEYVTVVLSTECGILYMRVPCTKHYHKVIISTPDKRVYPRSSINCMWHTHACTMHTHKKTFTIIIISTPNKTQYTPAVLFPECGTLHMHVPCTEHHIIPAPDKSRRQVPAGRDAVSNWLQLPSPLGAGGFSLPGGMGRGSWGTGGEMGKRGRGQGPRGGEGGREGVKAGKRWLCLRC